VPLKVKRRKYRKIEINCLGVEQNDRPPGKLEMSGAALDEK
jgi:hypothetical protein